MSANDLKKRVLDAKENLPKSGITSVFFHYFKEEYPETKESRSRLNNVLQLRVTDEGITEKLEQLVKLLTK